MRNGSKALIAGGLALVVGPFCVSAQAQDYIDVEAERAKERRDPYGAKPAESYPVTSFGVNNAPVSDQADRQSASSAPARPLEGGSGSTTGGNMGHLFLTVQQLQQEVMRLNGLVEEQAHELRTLREQSLERYVDLDRRLSLLAGGDPGGPAGDAGEPVSSEGAPSNNAAAVEQPGEGEAYQAAYALVRNQQFDQAVSAFQEFLQEYPAGRFAPNAYYWLGELHLVTRPPDPESARQSFMLLLDLYPNDSKVPDALFKLGKVHFDKGDREKAREFFDRLIRDHGSSNSAAVKLARDFIRDNY